MTTALLLVDVQRDMLDPPNPIPAEAEVRKVLGVLLTRARNAGIPVVHIQNDGPPGEPDEPQTKGWELVFDVAPGEIVIRKNQSNAFTNAQLGESLAARNVDQIVVAGMQSNYCVSATCQGALEKGLKVVLASGAHATYDEQESAATISEKVEQELSQDGVKVTPANDIWFNQQNEVPREIGWIQHFIAGPL